MYQAPTHDELVDEYRHAFEAGDPVTCNEILQFAKYDSELSKRLLAVENDMLADAPDVAIDLERVASVIHADASARRTVARAERWVTGHEPGIRAMSRYWPTVAALGFGLCLYLLGQTPLPPASWWLLGLATMCIGSIAVVCATSLWREYPTQRHRILRNDGAMSQTPPDHAPSGTENADGNKDGRVRTFKAPKDTRTLPSFLPGLAIAASVGVVGVVVLRGYTSDLDEKTELVASVEALLDDQNLLADGKFETVSGLVVPLRVRGGARSDEPVLIGARVQGYAEQWSLSIVDEDGALVGVTRGQNDSAILPLPDFGGDGEKTWYAFLELADADRSGQIPYVRWSMYGTDLDVGRDVGLKEVPAAASPADFRVAWIRSLKNARVTDVGAWYALLERAAEHEAALVDPKEPDAESERVDLNDD